MQTEPKPRNWPILGAALGTFIGLLTDQLALGMIFGFFAGIAIRSNKRNAANPGDECPPDSDRKD